MGFVRLGSGRLHRRTLAAVENPELDHGLIDQASHSTAERIDLPHQISLGQSTDGRITGHLSDAVQVLSDQHGVVA